MSFSGLTTGGIAAISVRKPAGLASEGDPRFDF